MLSVLEKDNQNFHGCCNMCDDDVTKHLHDGIVVRALTSQSVDLRFISLVELYQKT